MKYNYIKILLCTKDDYELIEPFILYYGTLFGFENLIIVDNNSSDERVLNIYNKYNKYKINVIFDKRSFMEMKTIMTEIIENIKDKCEWVFILDTDEFLFYNEDIFNKNSIIDKNKVINYLESIPDDVTTIRYSNVWYSCVDINDNDYIDYRYSCPPLQITKFKSQFIEKNIIRVKKFKSIQLFPHFINMISENILYTDILGLLHYHNSGIKNYLDRTITTIEGFGYYKKDNIDNIIIEICICKILVFNEVYGYHRIKEYVKFLYKKFIIIYFKNIIGRFPTIDEINSLFKVENIETIILNIIIYKNTFINTNINYNVDNTYYEETMKYDFEVYQIKNYLNKIISTI